MENRNEPVDAKDADFFLQFKQIQRMPGEEQVIKHVTVEIRHKQSFKGLSRIKSIKNKPTLN